MPSLEFNSAALQLENALQKNVNASNVPNQIPKKRVKEVHTSEIRIREENDVYGNRGQQRYTQIAKPQSLQKPPKSGRKKSGMNKRANNSVSSHQPSTSLPKKKVAKFSPPEEEDDLILPTDPKRVTRI